MVSAFSAIDRCSPGSHGVADFAATADSASAPAGAASVPRFQPRRYVMCRPTYFAVEYSINPWMDPNVPVDTHRACGQWEQLRATLEQLGHSVEVVPAQPGLPDMVFAANSGTVIEDQVLGALFRAPERAPEAEHFRAWFHDNGYSDVVMPSCVNEAEGDFVWTGRLMLAGSGFRTDPDAHAEAQEVFGVPVVSLRLTDPRYYHLDVALFVLENGSAPRIAYYPGAFSQGSQRALRRLFPDAVLADDTDAACFGLNAISDGKHVILPLEAESLAERLSQRGYEPIPLDVSELRKSGGGPKCCALELHS